MNSRSKALGAAAVLGVLGAGVGLWMATRNVEAADHLDPPARTNPDSGGTDRAADIADVFVWHGDGKVVLAMTYAGPNLPVEGQAATFDADVLYTFHIDVDNDQEADHNIRARFGQNASGNWGIQLEGIPGADPTTQSGPVEVVNRIQGVTDGFFYAGLRDDPFFFDLEGFRNTVSTGDLAFDNTRDFFAGQNSSAIVIELDADDLNAGDDMTFSAWATTGRTGG